ncbi:hypothetical protein [Naasia lichenicola]|uniref:Uncharacterized protein n=1 Tax=Naasia lichenicola TaxID=2565933 RepID=A0A4V3WTW1_9MICO|nr:hypothetical protein [Naasia lichenicola]THG33497.1 hypothetical protein E6C64_03950 [Naasia lichenicola]
MWHPILSATEVEPWQWHLLDSGSRPYAIIVALEIKGERGYRAVTWAQHSSERELLGYYRSLKAAVEGAHRSYIAAHARQGPVNGKR